LQPSTYSQPVDAHDVVILEGIAALAASAVSTRPVYRVLVERDEQARRASLLRDYLDRGYKEADFDHIYHAQLRDECSLFSKYRQRADSVIMSGLT
jgi:uridine kinase